MGKKLAIKGHPTRYKEVVEILKMLGGTECGYSGKGDSYYYYINEYSDSIVGTTELNKPNNYKVFTLEEFLEKYPFKINDRVVDKMDQCPGIIDKMKWDESTCDMKYYVSFGYGADYGLYTSDKIKFYNKNMKTVNTISEYKPVKSNAVKLVDGEVLDDLAKAESDMVIDTTNFMQLGKTVAVCFNKENYEAEVELQLGDYEIEVRDGKTYAVLKKPKYPKTLKECCEIVNACPTVSISYDSDEDMLYNDEVDLTLLTLRKLLICRNAYWKIAGKDMGLGKPWEPDWSDYQTKYGISHYKCTITLNEYVNSNKVLCFPTKEMRDAFFENFKDLIEQCMELL